MTDKSLSAARLAIGKIVKGHGLKGYLKVISYSGESEHFLKLKTIYLRINQELSEYRVEDVKRDKKNILIKLEGVDNLTEALKFILLEVWVNREQATPLKDGEYYLADIHGSEVYQKNRPVGRVNSLVTGGYTDMLEVITAKGKTLIIPLEKRFIKSIDIKEKRIDIEEDLELD